MQSLKKHAVVILITLTLSTMAFKQFKLEARVAELESRVDMHHSVLEGMMESIVDMEPVVDAMRSFIQMLMGLKSDIEPKA